MSSYRLARAAAALTLALLLPALVFAQDKNDKKQKQKEEATRAQVAVLAKAVDAAVSTPQAEAGVQWRSDFSMRGQENRTYLPFTLTIDAAKLKAGPAALYLRIARRAQPQPSSSPEKETKDDEGEKKAPAGPIYPFETLNTVQLKPESGQPYTLNRAILVPGGEYDFYAALGEQTGEPSKNKPALGRVVVFKQPITVPDYTTGELTTTPVLLAKKIDQLSAPLSPDQQAERPYTLGAADITPSVDHVFTKKDELPFLFVVYGVQVNDAGKPDMQIDYNFYQKTAEGEKFFNRTSPQPINGSTLPADANLTTTRQITGGQTIPLASFPDGEFRLEIKINDKLANKSITREVKFTVTP